MHTRTLLFAAVAFVAPATTATFAQPPRGGPPPEAIAACEGQEEGDICEFTGRRGETLEGTCRTHEALACVPAGHSERGPRPER